MGILKTIQIAFFLFIMLWCAACINEKKSKGVYYNPTHKESQLTDSERQKAIDTKRKELLNIDSLVFDNSVKLTILVPNPQNGLTQNVSNYAMSKMMQIVSKNGIGSIGGNPIFALAMTMTPLNQGKTTSISQQSYVNYDINLYVGNMITGDLYGSCRFEIMGVGNDTETAAINAISSLTNNAEIQGMLKKSSDRIIAWYTVNSKSFITSVESLLSMKQYSQALCLLKSVPEKAETCFAYAEQNMKAVAERLQKANAVKNLDALKNAIAVNRDKYNPEAGLYLSMIPADCAEKSEAQKLFDSYVANLDNKEKEAIEHQRFIEKEQLLLQKMELQLQIETNQTMIEKYQMDSENSVSDGEASNVSLASLFGLESTGGPFIGLIGEVVQLGVTEILSFLI